MNRNRSKSESDLARFEQEFCEPPPPYESPDVVVNQMEAAQSRPLLPVTVPYGLEPLETTQQLLIYSTSNVGDYKRFHIRNNLGEDIYEAVQKSCICLNPFYIRISKNKEDLIHIYSSMSCSCGCLTCCSKKLEISAPPSILVGTIEEEWKMFGTSFSIKNSHGNTFLKMEVPFFGSRYFGQFQIKLTSPNGNENLATIKKKMLRLEDSRTECLYLRFPGGLDARMKAVVLGAVFLADNLYFKVKNEISRV